MAGEVDFLRWDPLCDISGGRRLVLLCLYYCLLQIFVHICV